jgi:hypothetical protein
MSARSAGCAVAAAVVLSAFPAPGAHAMSHPREAPVKRVTGTVRVVGNEPFTRTVVTPGPSDSPQPRPDCLVAGPLEKELRARYQGKVVTLEGSACPDPPADAADCIVPSKIILPEK